VTISLADALTLFWITTSGIVDKNDKCAGCSDVKKTDEYNPVDVISGVWDGRRRDNKAIASWRSHPGLSAKERTSHLIGHCANA